MFSKVKLTVNRFKFVLVFSIFFVIAENIFYFINRFEINADSGAFSLLSNIRYINAEGILAILMIFIVLTISALINRYLLKIICVILLLTSGAFVYYILVDKLIVDNLFIGALFESDFGETGAVINGWVFVFWLIWGLLPAIYILFFVVPLIIFFLLIVTFSSKAILPIKLAKRSIYLYAFKFLVRCLTALE